LNANIIHLAETDSTNDEVRRRALGGAVDGLWVRADVQTAGRGRRGRQWVSDAGGNLYCSTLVRPLPDAPPVQQLSFVAAVAVQEALSAFAPMVRIKWPNDIMAGPDKLAGMLLERFFGNGEDVIIIGIGINLASAPDRTERPATSLRALTGNSITPAQMLDSVEDRFAAWRLRWQREGFAPVRDAWLATCAGLGSRIVVRLPDEELSGTFLSLASDGALELLLDSGEVKAIHAGDVFGF
jgi:BirA family transcriptional regulator, biotin operon repressor / biotin---[acetyl-CoA-carboxylase] ligase